jgi:hypothetical protein
MGGKPRFYWEFAISRGVNEKWLRKGKWDWKFIRELRELARIAANSFLTRRTQRALGLREGV